MTTFRAQLNLLRANSNRGVHAPHAHDPALHLKVDALALQLKNLTGMVTKMAKTIDDLVNDVTAENTVISSMETALAGLAAQVAALKSETTDPATAAKIDALATQIEGTTAQMTAALTANTPVTADAAGAASGTTADASQAPVDQSSGGQPQS